MNVDQAYREHSLKEQERLYREMENILRDMYALFFAGKADTSQHEALCDKADLYWYKLSPEQRKRLRDLSRDLYLEASYKVNPG